MKKKMLAKLKSYFFQHGKPMTPNWKLIHSKPIQADHPFMIHSFVESECLIPYRMTDIEYMMLLCFVERKKQNSKREKQYEYRLFQISYGSRSHVRPPNYQKLIAFIQRQGAKKVMLIHNHPYVNGAASALPSVVDMVFTNACLHLFKRDGIELVEHLILSPDEWYSFRENGLTHDDSTHFTMIAQNYRSDSDGKITHFD